MQLLRLDAHKDMSALAYVRGLIMATLRPQRTNLTHQCMESMKRYIEQNHLQPGDRLPTEHEWMDLLGVSRLVVREALQMLAGIGLVDVQQGRGAFVRAGNNLSVFDQVTFGLDWQHLHYNDVLEARAMLDLAVVELCMLRASDADFRDLEALLEQMHQIDAASEQDKELHKRFHYRLLHAAANPVIERIGTMLLDAFWRIGDTMPNLVHLSGQALRSDYESHKELLDTIKSRDLSRSRTAVERHLPFAPGHATVFPAVTRA